MHNFDIGSTYSGHMLFEGNGDSEGRAFITYNNTITHTGTTYSMRAKLKQIKRTMILNHKNYEASLKLVQPL